MTLIKCPSCQNTANFIELKCPHCGAVFEEEIEKEKPSVLKKIALIFLSGSISFVIYGTLLVSLNLLRDQFIERQALEMKLIMDSFIQLSGLVFIGAWLWLFGHFSLSEKDKKWGIRAFYLYLIVATVPYMLSFLMP